MANLVLTNQALTAANLQAGINTLESLLNQRKPYWDRMDDIQKKDWINGNKDPIFTLTWELYKYLQNNFFYGGFNG